jgi:hypothetical protein
MPQLLNQKLSRNPQDTHLLLHLDNMATYQQHLDQHQAAYTRLCLAPRAPHPKHTLACIHQATVGHLL